MRKTASILLFCIFLLAFAPFGLGQNLAIAPNMHPIFIGNNGQPLAGGFLYSYSAGTTSLQPTYIDGTGLIANANPIPLDSTGAASNGSVQTQIWLTNNAYKFCAFNAALVQQWCADNIQGTGNLLNTANTWLLAQTFSQPILISAIDAQIVMGVSGNQTTLDFPPPSSGGITLSFPTTADTMVGRNTFDTLNNKTLNQPQLTQPIVNGVIVENSPGTYISVSNSATGTVANTLTAVNSGGTTAQASQAVAGQAWGILGIAAFGAGTTGNVIIQQTGQASCVFDGVPTVGDFVQVSPTNNGNCHDAGAIYPSPGTGGVIGLVLTSTSSNNQYLVDLFAPGIQSLVIGNVVPTFTAFGAAGAGGTAACNGACLDKGGSVQVITGTSPASSAAIFTLNFGGTHSASYCTWYPGNAAAAAVTTNYAVNGPTFNSYDATTALTGSTTYIWDYTCNFKN